MRIAFFAESFRENMGGLTRAVIQFHDGLAGRGHRVRVFTLAQRGGALHPGDHVFVPALPLPGVGSLAPDTWLAYGYPFVLRELEAWAPDVVHLHTPFPVSWLGMRAARRLSFPVVATYHANVVGSAQAYARRMFRLGGDRLLGSIGKAEVAFYSSAHVVTAPSEAAASQLLERGLRAPVVVLSNGVDVARFRPPWKAEPGSGVTPVRRDRPPTALYVGRLSVEKGMADLALAIRRLLERHPSARFRVVGDGPWRGRLLRELEPWARSGQLEIAGYVAWERLPQLYRDADVFVFPSAVETQGLAVLEAMASGLPVVGVKGGAVPELVEDGKTGFLVSPGDGRALADTALRLLQDDGLRLAMAHQAREMAVRHRTEAAIALLQRVYESVIEARVSAQRRRSSCTVRVTGSRAGGWEPRSGLHRTVV
ncbi:MAG: glycosyltransferase [Limnochordaceae bacterium]|nr:glycosyltransferase [Limnochordaceae bacterium]